jgi:hypothetical protein
MYVNYNVRKYPTEYTDYVYIQIDIVVNRIINEPLTVIRAKLFLLY